MVSLLFSTYLNLISFNCERSLPRLVGSTNLKYYVSSPAMWKQPYLMMVFLKKCSYNNKIKALV